MATQAGNLTVRSDEVRTTLTSCSYRNKELVTSLDGLATSIGTAAELMSFLNEQDKVASYQELLAELGKFAHEVAEYDGAVRDFGAGYQASTSDTDFLGELDQRTDARLQQQPYDPAADARVQAFLQALKPPGGDAGAGGTDRDLGEDEDFTFANSGRPWVNDKCPLSMKDVLSLDKPYKDSRGYVYEYTSVMEYLRGQPSRQAKHPVAGVNQPLRQDELVPALEVEREKRRQRLQGLNGDKQGRGRQTQDEDTIDV